MAKKSVKKSVRKTVKKIAKKAAKQALDGRHRDKTGRKHGNTLVGSLRKTYGEHFAKGRRSTLMLKTLLKETGTESLHALSRQAPQTEITLVRQSAQL